MQYLARGWKLRNSGARQVLAHFFIVLVKFPEMPRFESSSCFIFQDKLRDMQPQVAEKTQERSPTASKIWEQDMGPESSTGGEAFTLQLAVTLI